MRAAEYQPSKMLRVPWNPNPFPWRLPRSRVCEAFDAIHRFLTSGSIPRFCFLTQTPQLKTHRINCFFDLIARKIMGRGLVRRDHPDRGPGAVVLRELTPGL